MTPVPERNAAARLSAGRDKYKALGVAGRRAGSARMLVFAGTGSFVLLLMPLVLPPYPLIVLSHALVFCIACLGLNLLFGTTGMLSLGHATYFGAGAYTGAFLYRFFDVNSFEVYLISGVVFSTVLAAVIGFLCVRVTKIYFAILTLAFAMVVHSLVINGAIFRLFGGLGLKMLKPRITRPRAGCLALTLHGARRNFGCYEKPSARLCRLFPTFTLRAWSNF